MDTRLISYRKAVVFHGSFVSIATVLNRLYGRAQPTGLHSMVHSLAEQADAILRDVAACTRRPPMRMRFEAVLLRNVS
jgi:hypothetical protein